MRKPQSGYLALDGSGSASRLMKNSASLLKVGVSSMLAVLFLGLVVLQGFAGTSNSAKADDGFDVTRWVMCYFGKQSIPGKMYQYTQTSELQFETQSKSSISSGLESVATGPLWLNGILSVAGNDFQKVNEDILGRPLQRSGSPTPVEGETPVTEPTTESTFNGGTTVNPFDRFGVAGMRFTAYTGEWKYIVVDACDPSKDAVDPKAGLYYENRLTPQSVWEDRGDSADIRTQQHNRGLGSSIVTSFMNIVANNIFTIAKFIVVITVALIGFAFTDLTALMGIDKLIGGGDGSSGIFGLLYEGVFTPLIVIVFALTGLNLLYKGIVKRQYRAGIIDVIRSVVLFVLAVVIAINPLPFIKLPNDIAVVAQSLIASAMNEGLVGGDGMCSTSGKATETDLVEDTSQDEAGIIEQASTNMRSAIGCSFWQQFLFRPWVQGQFGVDWNQTWAQGKTPEWAGDDSSEITSTDGNAEMVGDAAVPMGGGEVINNWALMQISTQTDAHAPYGKDGEYSKYTSGIANDWWRIVDVLSNYTEKVEEAPVFAGQEGTTGAIPETPSENVANGKLSSPLVNPTTSSPFGNRTHPITKKQSFHTGLDFPGSCGTTVMAAADGTVTAAGSVAIYGNRVEINHGGGIITTYSHMTNLNVSVGQQVTEGSTVGLVGTTGLSTGCHLHFEVKRNGTYVDPAGWLSGSGGNSSPDAGLGTVLVKYSVPMTAEEAPPNAAWNTWVGNSMGGRLAAALTAVFVASIGVVAPLFFAFLAAVYSIGVSLMMAFAPVMFLLGCWSSKGWEIFKGWGELVINATIARIITGVLLMMSIIFSATAIRFMETDNWWGGVLLMVLLSVILIRSRHKLIDMFAAVRFASTNFAGTSKRLGAATTGSFKTTGRIAGLATIGAVSAKASGGGALAGAKAASRGELRNLAYKSKIIRDGMQSYDTAVHHAGRDGDDGNLADRRCFVCQKKLDEYGFAYFDRIGNAYCQKCGEEAPPEDGLRMVGINSQEVQEEFEDYAPVQIESKYTPDMKAIVSNPKMTKEDGIENFKREASNIEQDIDSYQKASAELNNVQPPQPPDEIIPFLDMQKLKEAWNQEEWDYIRNVYAIAWTTWAVEEFSAEFSTMVTDILNEIRNQEDNIHNKNTKDETDEENG